MIDCGNLRPGRTIRIPFGSFAATTGAPAATSNYAAADILVYKDGNTTQRASASGITATTSFDTLVGINLIAIDLSDNTTADFWASGSEYIVVVSDITVDGQTLRFPIARFTIGYQDAIRNTTIATLASQTSFTLTNGSGDNNALVGCEVVINQAASAVGVCMGVISAYTGATRTVTLAVDPAIFTIAAKDNIAIFHRKNSYAIGGLVIPSGAIPAVAAGSVGGLINAPTTANTGLADVTRLLGTAWLAPGTAGTPDVNAKLWNSLATVALPLIPATAGRSLVVDTAGLADANIVKVGPSGAGVAQTAGDIYPGLAIADAGTAQNIIGTTGITLRAAAAFGTNALKGHTLYIVSATTGAGQSTVIDTNTNTGGANTVTFVAMPITLTGAVVYTIIGTPPSAADFSATQKASINTEVDTAIADAALATAANLAVVDAVVDNIKLVADKLNPMIVVSGSPGDYVFTASALELAPTGGSAPSAATIADAVWDEALSGHAGAGSAGEALAAAGTAGDPWTTALPGVYGAGTAGKIVGDNVNAMISSRASQSTLDIVDGIVDTILVDTNELQTDWVNGGRLDLILDARSSQSSVDTVDGIVDSILVDTAEIGAAGAGLTALASQASVTVVDDLLDTELPALTVSAAAIKAKTDSLTFTAAGKVDANTLAINGDATAAATSAILNGANVVYRGTVTGAATSTTLIDSGLTQADTDWWIGRIVIFTSVIPLQATAITAFNPATDQLTFVAVTQAPAGATYCIV